MQSIDDLVVCLVHLNGQIGIFMDLTVFMKCMVYMIYIYNIIII